MHDKSLYLYQEFDSEAMIDFDAPRYMCTK